MKKPYVRAALYGCILVVSVSVILTALFTVPKLVDKLGYYTGLLQVIPIEYRILYNNEKLIAESIDISKFPIVVEPRTAATVGSKTVFNVRTVDNEIYSILYDIESRNLEITYIYTDNPYWFKEDYLQILSGIKEQDDSVKDFQFLLNTFDSSDNIESIVVETDNGSQYSCIYNKDDEVVNINKLAE